MFKLYHRPKEVQFITIPVVEHNIYTMKWTTLCSNLILNAPVIASMETLCSHKFL